MTEAEFIAIAKRPPSEFERRMNGIPDSPRDIAAPGAWPWPISEDAAKWVDSHRPAHEQQFDSEAHRRFMRSL